MLTDIDDAVHWVGGSMCDAFLIAYLRAQGLKREDRLLDVGCGCLRLSRPIINYLDTGKYFGIDCSAQLIEFGMKTLSPALKKKRPTFVVNSEFQFEGFFDVILCHGVVCHMPGEEALRLFHSLRSALRGVAFVSYIERLKTKFHEKYVEHSFGHLARLSGTASLNARRLGDYGHPRGLTMMRLEAA